MTDSAPDALVGAAVIDATDLAVGIDTIGFELVVFERRGDDIVVTVRGMSSADDIELLVFETPSRVSISPVGSYSEGRIREFSLRTVVPINGRQRIVVQGAQGSEHVVGADVSEDLPVVCGADPTSPELPAEFLHKRGERYVLMGPGRSVSDHGSARRTTLVA